MPSPFWLNDTPVTSKSTDREIALHLERTHKPLNHNKLPFIQEQLDQIAARKAAILGKFASGEICETAMSVQLARLEKSHDWLISELKKVFTEHFDWAENGKEAARAAIALHEQNRARKKPEPIEVEIAWYDRLDLEEWQGINNDELIRLEYERKLAFISMCVAITVVSIVFFAKNPVYIATMTLKVGFTVVLVLIFVKGAYSNIMNLRPSTHYFDIESVTPEYPVRMSELRELVRNHHAKPQPEVATVVETNIPQYLSGKEWFTLNQDTDWKKEFASLYEVIETGELSEEGVTLSYKLKSNESKIVFNEVVETSESDENWD